MKYYNLKLILFFNIFILFSCQTTEKKQNEGNKKYTQIRKNVLQTAMNYKGKILFSKVKVKDRIFRLDCSGTVAAIFYTNNIDVNVNGGGVKNIYRTLKEKNLLYYNNPQPGDIIFWDNTYDANQDQLFGNDPLTHVGIIMKIDEDNTIHYLHADYYTRTITTNKMNLNKPDLYKDENGKIINDVLFSPLSKTVNTPLRLSSQLYKNSGNAIDKEL